MLSFHMFFTHLEAVKRLLYDNYSWHFQFWYYLLLPNWIYPIFFCKILVTYFSGRVICVDTVTVHGCQAADTFLQLIHSPGFHEKLPLRWLRPGRGGAHRARTFRQVWTLKRCSDASYSPQWLLLGITASYVKKLDMVNLNTHTQT